MGELYALSPFKPIFIAKSVLGGGGFSGGHRWGILGGRQGLELIASLTLPVTTVEPVAHPSKTVKKKSVIMILKIRIFTAP